MERGVKALRQEARARKADSDAQNVAPVPGKDVSPYDGRPASWWAENVGGGKRGDLRSGRGCGLETGAQHVSERPGQESVARDEKVDEGDRGSGGPVAGDDSGAAVDIGRETQADGTRLMPATADGKGRGWDSVVVEESDVLACGGYLPEKYIGGAGENDHDSEAAPAAALPDDAPNPGTASSESEEGGTCDTHLNGSGAVEVTHEGMGQHGDGACDEGVGDSGRGALTLDVRECAAGGGDCANAPNEANFGDDVCIAQRRDIIEVPTNSGGVSGLDGCQANPISLETKPIAAGGTEAGGIGGVDDRTDRPDRTDSVAGSQREREALAARMWQQFVQMQAARWGGEPGQPAMFRSGVANSGEAAAEEPMVSQDARGP